MMTPGRWSQAWFAAGCVALVAACGGSQPAAPGATNATSTNVPDAGPTGTGTGTPDGGSSTSTPPVTTTSAGGGSTTTTPPVATTNSGGTGTSGAPDAGVTLTPPVTKNGWTFYGTGQGLSQDISDVSADEGGAVYVAGGDALYAKKRGDQGFLRFDASNAGLTQNCYQGVLPPSDPGFAASLAAATHPTPPGPATMCPVLSVAGTAPGAAVIGFRGIGTDDDSDAAWAMDSGGADVVKFDGTTLSRTRHVLVASPPDTICVVNGNETHATSCPNTDFYWVNGREKLRQVFRIVANHQQGSPEYGDVWMGGTHATLTALLQNASARGYLDRTLNQPARWADAKDVWEHDHPALYLASTNQFLTGYTYGIAIDPKSGTPWGSNGFRTAWMAGYGADLHSDVWWLEPIDATHPDWIDVWPDNGDPLGPGNDNIASLSFCDDGTLWMGSSTHGLATRAPSGAISTMSLPDPAAHGNNVYAVACDPSDGSIWIGLGWGGVMRYKNGQFTTLDPSGLPAFVNQPVQSIQIDRWSTPRIVYFAFLPSKDATGKITQGGGVAAYSGP